MRLFFFKLSNAVFVCLRVILSLCDIGYEVPSLIHEKAYVSPSAKIGIGCFIEPMAVVHTAVEVETGCILSAGVILNHNSTVHEGCHKGSVTTVLSGSFASELPKNGTGDVRRVRRRADLRSERRRPVR